MHAFCLLLSPACQFAPWGLRYVTVLSYNNRSLHIGDFCIGLRRLNAQTDVWTQVNDDDRG